MAEQQEAVQYIEFDDLVAKRMRSVYVPLGQDFGVTLEWNPDAMTPEVYEALPTEADAGNDPFVVADKVILPLVAGWSLRKGGKPFPVTKENVEGLGLQIVKRLNNALLTDFRVAASEDYTDTKDDSGDIS